MGVSEKFDLCTGNSNRKTPFSTPFKAAVYAASLPRSCSAPPPSSRNGIGYQEVTRLGGEGAQKEVNLFKKANVSKISRFFGDNLGWKCGDFPWLGLPRPYLPAGRCHGDTRDFPGRHRVITGRLSKEEVGSVAGPTMYSRSLRVRALSYGRSPKRRMYKASPYGRSPKRRCTEEAKRRKAWYPYRSGGSATARTQKMSQLRGKSWLCYEEERVTF